MTVKLHGIQVQVKAVQPKVRVTKDGSEKQGVTKLFAELDDGPAFLKGINRGGMKLWPDGVGTVISIPIPEMGIRAKLRAGKHQTQVEMDAHLKAVVLPENRLALTMTLKGQLTDKAVTSLWAIQADGGATADIESIQGELPTD